MQAHPSHSALHKGWWLLRLVRWQFGLIWSGGLILVGLWSFDQDLMLRGHNVAHMAGLCAIAAGEFVLMWVVIDDVCPDAEPMMTGLLKLVAAMLFWGAGGLCVYLVLPS